MLLILHIRTEGVRISNVISHKGQYMHIIENDNKLPVMAKPFALTKSNLGALTKLFDAKFICNETGVHELHQMISEKINYLHPTSGGFQYLISFSDNTHLEHSNISTFSNSIKNNSKTTERLVLKWTIIHKIGEEDNELTIIIRITNPINPLAYLQAALSKTPQDIDDLSFEGGTVSVSTDGAGQIVAEEIFSITGKWIESRPAPQYITTINKTINEHKNKISFLNYWFLPTMIASMFFMTLWKHTPQNLMIPILFGAFITNSYLRTAMYSLNRKIHNWCRRSDVFSAFLLTGGDTNQQAAYASYSKISLIKLVTVTIGSFLLSVGASITATFLISL